VRLTSILKAALVLACVLILVGPVRGDDFPKVGDVTAAGTVVAVGKPVVTSVVYRDAAGKVIRVEGPAPGSSCPCGPGCDCPAGVCPTGCATATPPASIQYALPPALGAGGCPNGQCPATQPARRGLFR